MKNRKERGWPGKIYHARNVIERTWLHVCEQMNSPTLHWQNVLVQSRKLYGWQNETRQHYVTLGRWRAMVSVHRPVHLKIMLTYSLTWQGVRKCQGSPFLSFAQGFSALIFQINCQNKVSLKHGFVYCRLRKYGHRHIDDLPTLN